MPVAAPTTIRLTDSVQASIAERSSKRNQSVVIRRDLARYYDMLSYRFCSLAAVFTDSECGLLLDATSGADLYTFTPSKLASIVQDAMKANNLAAKWGVDADVLAKLDALHDADTLAVIDACERWWVRYEAGQDVEHAQLFR